MPVELRCESGRPYARALLADSRRLMRIEGLVGYELSVMLVGDRTIRRLNRRFRGNDRPTDVLSFSQLEDRQGTTRRRLRRSATAREILPAPLGDVVISLDTAARQAALLGVTVRSRLRSLLVHGFLHILGHDHERSAREARLMSERERMLERALSSHDGGRQRLGARPGN